MSVKWLVPLFALSACASAPVPAPEDVRSAPAMGEWVAICEDFDEWDKPGPPYRIQGNTYYVGSCGIASVLVTSPHGHVLIDSGTDEGAKIVLANIRALGFDPRDVKTILMSHEHFDHIGGMARLQSETGATVLTSPAAAAVLRSGLPGADDPQAHSGHPPFPPVTGTIDTLASDRTMNLSGREFTPLSTPGHTPGALSWSWSECEGKDCRMIVYADSLNPISSDDYRFSDHPRYVADFREGIARIAAARCDILLTPHPSSGWMRERMEADGHLLQPGQCARYAKAIGERLEARLAKEADGG